jgi:threonine/homoserine/homoserine lactone efflux protein
MVEIIIKGILIGLCISVPVGPIGMLCIQRTLNRGRSHGIAIGLGATVSDLVYTLISLFFLSFVLELVEQYRLVIQIGGSVALALFGFFIYKSHPSVQPKPHEVKRHGLLGDFASSFALTLSNPFILFILIALFARFEFIDAETTLFLTFCGIFSIAFGALLWWNTLTFLVSHFRSRLNMSGLRILNQIAGFIIILIALIGGIISIF